MQSHCAEFDTAALALLLQAKRLAQAPGRAFEVQGATAQAAATGAALWRGSSLLGLGPADAGYVRLRPALGAQVLLDLLQHAAATLRCPGAARRRWSGCR